MEVGGLDHQAAPLDDISGGQAGAQPRVMRASDWSGGGYQEFQLTEGINPLDDEG